MQLDLGKKIRELRQRDGRTQETLAEAIGVTSQAVSRWEASGGYPDMEMIPSLANYFGVSIDELFGYNNERSKKTDELAEKIEHMNTQNNGVNFNIDECILKARDALIEFPGNEKLTVCIYEALPHLPGLGFLAATDAPGIARQLVLLAVAAVLYAVVTDASCRSAQHRFEHVDL